MSSWAPVVCTSCPQMEKTDGIFHPASMTWDFSCPSPSLPWSWDEQVGFYEFYPLVSSHCSSTLRNHIPRKLRPSWEALYTETWQTKHGEIVERKPRTDLNSMQWTEKSSEKQLDSSNLYTNFKQSVGHWPEQHRGRAGLNWRPEGIPRSVTRPGLHLWSSANGLVIRKPTQDRMGLPITEDLPIPGKELEGIQMRANDWVSQSSCPIPIPTSPSLYICVICV